MPNVATAPINTIPAVQVAGAYAPVQPLPVVASNVPMPPLAPVAARAVVVLAGGTPYAPVAPIPMQFFTAGTVSQAPTAPIPIVIVG
jgi:hypothetical protein